jgi:hypothetical protein
MQIHALDFNISFEEEYTLIGIHTALEDYKLAYLLNKNLQTRFTKSKEELMFEKEKNEASFSLYNYKEAKCEFDWFLISNSFRIENESQNTTLLLSSEVITYLIPEKKKVDFFLKISGDLQYEFVIKTVEKIKRIGQVVTAYTIDKNSLKSKDFLTF